MTGQLFNNPFPRFTDSNGNPLEGGKLFSYVTATSTKTETYTTSALSVANDNPIVLNARGEPDTAIWLDPAITYRFVLAAATEDDPPASSIWAINGVLAPGSGVATAVAVYAGNPNGNVAGTAGTVDVVDADMIYDINSDILYVCTTSGTASTAVWTNIASSISGAVVFGGQLSPSAISTQQDNYAPTDISTAATIRLNITTDAIISGIDGGATGRELLLINVGTANGLLRHEDGDSDAENRFHFGPDIQLRPKMGLPIRYDGVSSRWRCAAQVKDVFEPPNGRLTLTTATAVLSSDVTAAATVYFTPYKGNLISLYNGTGWMRANFTEVSQLLSDATKSPAAGATDSVYDFFGWVDDGTFRCTRGPAWTSATGRGTGAGTSELVLVNGVYMNNVAITNGPAANRGIYLGSVATDGSTQCNMMFAPSAAAGGGANRLDVWNMYNRIDTSSVSRDSTDSWAYSTATIRSANNNTANRVTFVRGLNEESVSAKYQVPVVNSGNNPVMNAIGLDATNAIASGSSPGSCGIFSTAPGTTLTALYEGIPGLGRHFLQALEWSTASGTTTWYGDNAAATLTQMMLSVRTRM